MSCKHPIRILRRDLDRYITRNIREPIFRLSFLANLFCTYLWVVAKVHRIYRVYVYNRLWKLDLLPLLLSQRLIKNVLIINFLFKLIFSFYVFHIFVNLCEEWREWLDDLCRSYAPQEYATVGGHHKHWEMRLWMTSEVNPAFLRQL